MLVLHKLIPAGFSILLCAACVLGQATSASVSGTVTDQNAAVIPGAVLIIKNTETGQERKVQTDGSGNYSVVGLSPGKYDLRVERQGFNSETRTGLKLTVAEEAVLNVQLNVSGVQEAVQVTDAGAAQVETNTSTISGLVDEKKIRDLP